MDIEASHIQVGTKNTSEHKSYDEYFKNKWFKNKMYQKMKADVDLYDKICNTLD